MEEKKSIKVSLGTTICVFIIFLLVIGIVAMYYFGFIKNNEKIGDLEAQTVALQEKVNSLQETKSTIELQTKKTDDEIKELIKNYILTDFGPQNNMKNVTVDTYKEITAEEYFSRTPGGPLTEEEKTEFLRKNPDLMYGYCKFTIELIDVNKLTLAGSKPSYQETVGNSFKSEAIFTLNKNTNEINFATTYGFGKTNNNTKIEVEDAVNYVDGYYGLFKVKLPKVVGNTDTIEKLNLKILNEVLPLTYADIVCHAETDNTAMDKGSIYDYKYSIDNNILIIYVFSTVPEGGSTIPATGGGLNYCSYHYDIINDKILSLEEAAEMLKLELEGLETNDGNKIESYKELDENAYVINVDEKNNIKLVSTF